jgi:hypothetical protein
MKTRIPKSPLPSSKTRVPKIPLYSIHKFPKSPLPSFKSILKTSVDTSVQQKAPQSNYHVLMNYWKSTPDGEANPSEPLWSFHLNLSFGADVNMLTDRMSQALSTHRLCFKTLRSLLTVAPSCFKTCRALAAPTVPWPSGPIYKPQGGMLRSPRKDKHLVHWRQGIQRMETEWLPDLDIWKT